MATDATVHRALADPSRVRILEAVRSSEQPVDAAVLASVVGLHPNTVRSHLRVLTEAGLVEPRPEDRRTRGRPRIIYAAAGEPTEDASTGYRLLAEILASELARTGDGSVDRAENAGRAWGRYLVGRRRPYSPSSEEEEVDAIVGLLEEAGFDPALEPAAEGHTVIMQHCPFGEVADHYRKIVCSVHLGLMQGALAELDAHVEAGELEPLVRPGVCSARLQTTR